MLINVHVCICIYMYIKIICILHKMTRHVSQLVLDIYFLLVMCILQVNNFRYASWYTHLHNDHVVADYDVRSIK